MKIILIRHSRTKLSRNIPITLWRLSEDGISLTKELSRNANIKDLDVIYSSLQTKALETTLLLAKPNAISIKTHSALTEITSFTNKFLNNYEESVQLFYNNKVEQFADGESYKEALERFNHAIEEIVLVEKNKKNIGVVSHLNILSFFSAQYSAIKPIDLEKTIQMPDLAILDYNKKRFIKHFGRSL